MKGKTTVNGVTVNGAINTQTTRIQGDRDNYSNNVGYAPAIPRGNTQDSTGYSPAVPISVYRELSKELEKAKQRLSIVEAQNLGLKQQNQALRQEVIRVIQSAATLKDILQTPKLSPSPQSSQGQPPVSESQSASSSPQIPSGSNIVAGGLIAELDYTLAADIHTSFQATSNQAISVKTTDNTTDGVVGGPFCEVAVPDLRERTQDLEPAPLFTEQPTTPPNAIALEGEEKSGFLGGIWLPLTLVFVIITAFSAGFLIVLPFIEADRNN